MIWVKAIESNIFIMLDSKEQAEYYIVNKKEFEGDDGYNKLLSNLARFVPQISGKTLAIDVGACIGEELGVLNSFLQEKESKLVAIEPNPVNVEVLEQKKICIQIFYCLNYLYPMKIIQVGNSILIKSFLRIKQDIF